MSAAVSLKKHGLRADNLDCPAGGFHVVPEAAVVLARARGGADVPCLNCNTLVKLTTIEEDTDG